MIQRKMEAGVPPIFGRARMTGNTVVEHGEFVVIDTSAGTGRARPLSFNANYAFVGIADETADNSAGSNDDIGVRYRQQAHLVVPLASITGADPEDVGQPVYATDAELALTMTAASGVKIGTLAYVDEVDGVAGIFVQGAGVAGV